MKFEFQNPTQLIFGAGTITRLGEMAKAHGSRALLVTGGGSVKRSGTLDRALQALQAAGLSVTTFSGVEPNPRITTVRRGAEKARQEGCDLIVALGGGSVMDAAKVMAAAARHDEDPWSMIHHGQKEVFVPTLALPLITVPTLAATGSEMNMGAVITNEETSEKSFVQAPCLYPRVAILDPELTLSVPQDQTAYGICDLITHVTEPYFNSLDQTPLQDRFAEGIILTAMEYGPQALAHGNDLEARTQIQWAATLALNGWVQAGAGGRGYPVHMMEHTVSATHDITHAVGLSIINPAWMRFAAQKRPRKFVQFAERIFHLSAKGPDDLACALRGIEAFERFLKETGCPTRFSEINIDARFLEAYADETLRIAGDGKGHLYGVPLMDRTDILSVLQAAL